MFAATPSESWTSNGKQRYIPYRRPVLNVAVATPCPSPCFPFSPKEYIERFGKKSTKITKNGINCEYRIRKVG